MDRPVRRLGRPKGFNAPRTKSTVQALDRAVDVLEALALADGLTLTELSKQLDQSPATAHRVLSTLEARELAEIDQRTQSWHVGPLAFRLGAAFLRRSDVIERSRPVMRELMLETGETSNLGIERRDEVMFVSQVETQESIRAFFPPGTSSPMHASGIGKALLSCYSPDRLDAYLDRAGLEQFTPRTITTAQHLKDELERIRERGWALDDEEKAEGMRCIASPVRDVYGEAVAGISISGPTSRLPESVLGDVGERVANAARRISYSMGFTGQTAEVAGPQR